MGDGWNGRRRVPPSRIGSAGRALRGALIGLGFISLGVEDPLAAQGPASRLSATAQGSVPSTGVAPTQDPFTSARQDMVDRQVKQRGIRQPNMLSALEEVPRHRFVPESVGPLVYRDAPVSFAPGQNLSQVYVSARMISLLNLTGDEKVLEIGTGSGYDAALLSRMAKRVYTVEIDSGLGEKARSKLEELGYDNVEVRVGDGYHGWPDEAPFDAILLTAAPQKVPEPLFQQLKIGGRMVVAVGYSLHQDLKVITRTGETEREIKRVNLISLTPMTGEAQDGAPPSRY